MHQRLQIVARDVLHDQEVALRVAEHIPDARQPLVVQILQVKRLPMKLGARFCIHQTSDLDSHLPAVLQVMGQVDRAHAAAAKLALHLVTAHQDHIGADLFTHR